MPVTIVGSKDNRGKLRMVPPQTTSTRSRLPNRTEVRHRAETRICRPRWICLEREKWLDGPRKIGAIVSTMIVDSFSQF